LLEDPLMEDKLVPYQAVPLLPCTAAIAFAAHPDDEVFGCGGALALHAQAGHALTVVVLSDGAFGVGDEQRAAHIAMREAESQAAAAVLGYPAPQFWRLPDRGLEYGEELIERLMAAIGSAGADLVYAPALSEMHPDHRALAMAAVEAVRRLGQPLRLAMYETGVPLAPNLLLDISGVAERKGEAMRCFPSQLAVQPYDAHIAALNRYRTYTLPKTVQAAEAFHLVDAAALARDPLQLFASEYAKQARLGLALDADRDLPLVSVVIRSMDRGILAEALDALAVQTYPHLEVLVVNAKGGAHRDLGTRCGRFPLRLINAGGAGLARAAAANAGLEQANGEFAAFLDDDDTVDAGHYSQLVTAARQAGEGAVVYAGVRCIDRADPARRVFRVFAEDFEAAKLLAGNFIPIHAPLFPRRFFSDGVRFDESLELYEDWDFWLQLARRARFVHLPQVSATYFSSGTSGVAAFAPDPEAVRQASAAFYAKWSGHLGAADLQALSALYHRRSGEANGARESELRLAAQLNATEAQRNAAEEQLQAAQAEVARLLAHVAGLQQACAGSQAELAAVYQSTSWRLTAPLRRLCGYRRPS
jgi:LmbE family N-acetylglucosaminyl deacetylase